jgi:hypothetical protein
MISILKRFTLVCSMLVLSSCGGGSSQINNPTITLVTPVSTVIAAGTKLQLNAIVAGSSNTTVLWFVNNIPGGNSTVGTITPQGLYTAPTIPTQNGSVDISASPQSFPSISTSILIGITFANVSMSGDYVFTLSGTEAGSPWATTGSFTANGDGSISNGVEDINGPSGISTALAFTGSYLINANGQGVATITNAQGSITVALTLNTQGQAVATRTDSGDVATGIFYPQLPTALTLTNLDAPYVFNLSGLDQSGKLLNTIGVFVTDGSTTLSYAEEDLNDGGTTANQPFSGTYSLNGSGHGTATFTDSTGTRIYSFYIVSPTQLQFIEIDNQGHLNGSVYQQQSVTSTTVLSGGYVFYAMGDIGTTAYGTAGGFTTSTVTNDYINAATNDINSNGNSFVNASLTGTFTNGAYGRGTITLTAAGGSNNYIYYFISPSAAFLITADSGINASGELFYQTSGYSTASLVGNYTLTLASTVDAVQPSSAVGLISLNGSGALAGYQNTNDNGTSSGQLSVTGTYAVTGPTSTTSTRGIATLVTDGGANADFAFYPISSSALILLGENGPPKLATLVSQY